MRNENSPFQAEQVYEQLGSADAGQTPPSSDAHLISWLRQVYTQDREIVEQVWEKLNVRAFYADEPGEEHAATSQLPEHRLHQAPVIKQRSRTKRPQRPWSRVLEVSAALLVVASLIGSMVLLLQKAHQRPGSVENASTPVVATQTGCNLSRPATLMPLSAAADPAVFYLRGTGRYQTTPGKTSLIRSDLLTGKAMTLFQSPGDSAITQVMLSPDRQWLLLQQVERRTPQKTEIQVIRTDGRMLQTVYESCTDSGVFFSGRAVWSPGGRDIAFTDTAASVGVLDLLAGKLQRFSLSRTNRMSYQPAFWADNQHVLVEQFAGTCASQVGIELLDIRKGTGQTLSALTPITSFLTFCGNIASGDQHTQLFSSSCQPFEDSCQGRQPRGPSSVSVLPATGGAARTIYTSPSRAVTAIASAGSLSLLLYIDNTRGISARMASGRSRSMEVV